MLFLFALAFIGLSMTGLCLGILNLGPADYVRLTLLYISVTLSYAILCSAVEVRSPTRHHHIYRRPPGDAGVQNASSCSIFSRRVPWLSASN